MFRILNWSPSITRRIMARRGRLCDVTHDCLSLMLRSCSLSECDAVAALKARRLQITGAPTPVGALMSRRKIMISLSPPIKAAAHACFSVGTRSSEKHGGRPRDVNMPSVLFVPRFPLRIFYRVKDASNSESLLQRYNSMYSLCDVSNYRLILHWKQFSKIY